MASLASRLPSIDMVLLRRVGCPNNSRSGSGLGYPMEGAFLFVFLVILVGNIDNERMVAFLVGDIVYHFDKFRDVEFDFCLVKKLVTCRKGWSHFGQRI